MLADHLRKRSNVTVVQLKSIDRHERIRFAGDARYEISGRRTKVFYPLIACECLITHYFVPSKYGDYEDFMKKF